MLGAACFMDNPVATVVLLTIGLSLASFSYAGLYCNHQDMSPRYASILLGMTNTMVWGGGGEGAAGGWVQFVYSRSVVFLFFFFSPLLNSSARAIISPAFDDAFFFFF